MKITFASFSEFPVELGVTTRHFPLFLSGVPDLFDSQKQLLLLNAFPETEKWAYPEQVHGAQVKIFPEQKTHSNGIFQMFPGTDGLLTAMSHVTLSILTADCLPIFFLVPDPLAVGLVHAGWRGSAGTIAASAVETLRHLTGQSPGKFLITFGPCIGVCCYEVGEEFKGAFRETVVEREGKCYLDLVKENRLQLQRGGVQEANIRDSSVCTFCHPETFYSYRRDKNQTGRMLSWIRITRPE